MELAALGIRIDGVADADRAASSLDKLTDSGKRAGSTTTSLSKGFSDVTKILSEIGRSVSPLSAQIDALSKSIGTQSSAITKMSSSTGDASKNIDSLTNASRDAAAEADTLGATLKAAIDETSDLGGAQRDVAREAENMAKALDSGKSSADDLSDSADELGDELGEAEISMRGLSSAAKYATGILAGLGVAIGIRDSIRQIADFQEAINGLEAVTGASASQVAELESQARMLGATSRFSAQQAAEGQRFLAQAGFDVNQVLASTPGILRLASAGQLDLAEAADIASNVLGGMRLEVDQLARVSDVLAATGARTNTNISQLGRALSFAAPFAASAKISIEEAAAAIGVMSDAGIQASRAGTGLVGVIRQLSNVTGGGEDVLKKYGLTIADVNIEARGLAPVLESLREVNLTTGDAIALFGSEAGAAAQMLVSNYKGAIADAAGEAARMAGIMDKGLTPAMLGLSSAVSESILQLGDSGMAGSLESVIRNATGVISVWNGMGKEWAESNDVGVVTLSIIEGVAVALSTAAKVAGIYVVAIYGIPLAKAAASVATAAYGRVLASFTAQVTAATGAVTMFQRSLFVVGAALAGWQIGTYLRNQFEFVEKAGIALAAGLHTTVIRIGGFFSQLGENIKFAVTSPIDSIRGSIADLLEWMTGLGRDALNFLGFEGLAAGVKTEFAGVRGATAAEHKATIDQIKKDTQDQIKFTSDIYAEMFAEVGKGANQAADATGALGDATGDLSDDIEDLNNNLTELSDIQKSIISDINDLEQAVVTWGMTADEVTLYTLALRGASDAQQLQAANAIRAREALDAQADAMRRIRDEQARINSEARSIAESLLTEEEMIRVSYERRKQIILDNTEFAGEAQTELLKRLEEKRNKDLVEANGTYWQKWLLAAEKNLTSFDEIAGKTIEQFSKRFGDAFESAIFDAEDFGDAMQGIMQGMARSVVNAIGQMIAQELAYQAVKALTGDVAERSATMELAAIAKTQAASLAATATTVASQVAAAATTFAAWLPSAIAASIGSFGAAAAIGASAVLAAVAMKGFRDGGYTGDGGINEVAGVVHGKEYVFDASSTARIGVDNLDAMRRGQALPGNVVQMPAPSSAAQSRSPSLPPIIEIHNYGNNEVEVETEQNAQGQDIIRVVVSNILTSGEIADAVNQITGTQFQGS